MTTLKLISYIIANLIMTVTLLWGLRVLIKNVTHEKQNCQSILQQSLSEKVLPPKESVSGKPENQLNLGSFSRVAGSFGAMALTAATVGISYWLIYALFSENSTSISETLKSVGFFFLAGSALFAPYAFNQLSSLFKVG
ncbi:hypothetical protein [Vibrio sp. DNB22_12_1]